MQTALAPRTVVASRIAITHHSFDDVYKELETNPFAIYFTGLIDEGSLAASSLFPSVYRPSTNERNPFRSATPSKGNALCTPSSPPEPETRAVPPIPSVHSRRPVRAYVSDLYTIGWMPWLGARSELH
ncbi:hypothetical protein CALCODRAFT_500302 [Calocera cornea HHB12733]|uniref:Uncharacterized protein n=1 Tax=Calocera cornea HHB12733 TaxID=1353952 RepID=A0A165E452_9BASI|nr:hypothetical protein CALCODRAFT_500302 [Calocera cornea HHB12733]